MIISAYRIVKTKRVPTAFSGVGAKLNPGRWNTSASLIVYTSDTPASATLEMLVHFDATMPVASYSIMEISFPRSLVEELDPGLLPSNWYEPNPPTGLAVIGDEWIRDGRSAVLKVPSVTLRSGGIPQHDNYLLNPSHPDFPKIDIGLPEIVQIDQRLITALSGHASSA